MIESSTIVPRDPRSQGIELIRYFGSWEYVSKLMPYVPLPVNESMKNSKDSPGSGRY